MVRVLHIVLGLQVGGLEKFVLALIDNYSSEIKPYIVCLKEKGELGDRHPVGADIIELDKKPGIDLKLAWQLAKLVRKLDIDVIHSHNPAPHFYGALTSLLTGRALIHTKHGRNYPGNWRKVGLNRFSSLLTDMVVAVSQDAADVCLSVEKIPSKKVMVILNGIDTTLFRPPIELTARSGPLKIGIVARLSAEKDHETLLNACKILLSRTTGFHLDIIGDGSLKEELSRLADTLEIAPYVTFCGMRHDVPEALQQLDLFVLSSTTEGISLTLLEAMATALPIVATRVGGNPEVVIDGKTGVLVPPRNPEILAEKLLLLIQDEKLRRQMGENGRVRVLEFFSIRETASRYEKLYQHVVKRS